jgi:hypothetical protein
MRIENKSGGAGSVSRATTIINRVSAKSAKLGRAVSTAVLRAAGGAITGDKMNEREKLRIGKFPFVEGMRLFANKQRRLPAHQQWVQ